MGDESGLSTMGTGVPLDPAALAAKQRKEAIVRVGVILIVVLIVIDFVLLVIYLTMGPVIIIKNVTKVVPAARRYRSFPGETYTSPVRSVHSFIESFAISTCRNLLNYLYMFSPVVPRR